MTNPVPLPLPKISGRARRQLARASIIAAGGKFLSPRQRDRAKPRPITFRLAQNTPGIQS